MTPLTTPTTFSTLTTLFFPSHNHNHNHNHNVLFKPRPHRFTPSSLQNDSFHPPSPSPSPPRTLFPGGSKRADIKVPDIILHVTPQQVLTDGAAVEFIDAAVADTVGIVVVGGGDGGGKLYEAACLLKSIIRDRAYLLVSDRVDIAVAINASGVLLSDQGLPPIVARNTLMSSKPESVFLPVVGKMVETVDAAIFACDSEGADFLIISSVLEEHTDIWMETINRKIQIPVFYESSLIEKEGSLSGDSMKFLSGASGIVTTLEELMLNGDLLRKVVYNASTVNGISQKDISNFSKLNMLNTTNGLASDLRFDSFVDLEDSKAQFIKREKRLLVAAANVIEKSAPLMEEISLLNDAISQLAEPFLLVIVGEFNSGKSTFINALLGGKFLKDGVIPTTNEITFLRYTEVDTKQQESSERHLDGRYVRYLPSQILQKMIVVDTPGTNVILQRQQRLTEEFIPRADLLLFVLSADRPLTESEVAFLRYTQQWKKKVVFLLNKADMYRNSSELDEAITFVKDNVQKLLNVEDVKLFPISARSALDAKLTAAVTGTDPRDLLASQTYSSTQGFTEFENFLNGFLDLSTSAGMERIKIKLETPISIAERLLFSCQTLVTQDHRYAKKDLMSLKELMGTVQDKAIRMESECISWRRQISSLVEGVKLRVVKLVESTLQLSNLDLAFSLISKGDKSALTPTTQSVHNDIVSPALSDAQRLLVNYTAWLNENYAEEVKRYKETLEKRWPLAFESLNQMEYTTNYLLNEVDGQSVKSIEKFSGTNAARLFNQEIRQVFLGAFGGLAAAGLSASLLTSVLSTTLEDLLALGLCSAGGLLAISSFPARKQLVINKVKSIANSVGQEIEEAMQKDLLATIKNMECSVAEIGKPYEDAAQKRLDELTNTQEELTEMEKKLKALQVELQNLHLS
ncbi:hypothetical protein vseg_010733 [Gypsophila vaccaria]